MSAIASFYVIDRATAADIVAADDPNAVLQSRGRGLDDDLFCWSGYCMVFLIEFLDQRGISSAAQDSGIEDAIPAAVAVFGAGDRGLLARLGPARFTPEELAESMSDLDLDEEEAIEAATDGLNALRAGIEALGDDDLLAVTVD